MCAVQKVNFSVSVSDMKDVWRYADRNNQCLQVLSVDDSTVCFSITFDDELYATKFALIYPVRKIK